MTGSTPTTADLDRMEAAADWLVRLHDAPGDEALRGRVAAMVRGRSAESAGISFGAAGVARGQLPHRTPSGQPPLPVERQTNRRVWLGLAATVLIAIGIGSFALLRTHRDELLQSYATPIAGTGSSVLPDGSRVELGADSRHHDALHRQPAFHQRRRGRGLFSGGEGSRPSVPGGRGRHAESRRSVPRSTSGATAIAS